MMSEQVREDGNSGNNLLVVVENQEGQRIDNFLFKHYRYHKKSIIYKIIRSGQVRIDGSRCKPSTRILANNIVRVPPAMIRGQQQLPNLTDNQKQKILATIFFDNKHLLAINKPAGLPVHAGTSYRYGLIEALRSCLSDGDNLELVHRIDRLTSGCVLVARTADMRKQLHNCWRNKRVKKIYFAVVYGRWLITRRVVDLPLSTHDLDGHTRVLVDNAHGKPSTTFCQLLGYHTVGKQEISIVMLKPLTGRMHQLRVHCQSVGHPILGDPRYQNKKQEQFSHSLRLPRELYLHAHSVSFSDHVVGFEDTEFVVPGNIWRSDLYALEPSFATIWSKYIADKIG